MIEMKPNQIIDETYVNCIHGVCADCKRKGASSGYACWAELDSITDDD
jgi:hypothetical protein